LDGRKDTALEISEELKSITEEMNEKLEKRKFVTFPLRLE
jgi:iron-sulfur cluster repair protein YtfE (RIC family)